MNRIRPGLSADMIEAATPPARPGLVLVERLRAFNPDGLFAVPRRTRATRVLHDYPGASAKLVNYVLKEGFGPTLEKTRTKLDQKRVATELAMAAVGTVAACPADSGLKPGDVVACGGFLLPVAADTYLFHPDQCRKVPHDVAGLESHFWLGAFIELARSLANGGARTIVPLGLGPLADPLSEWLSTRGWLAEAAGTADAAVAASAGWEASRDGARPPVGIVLDPFGVCRDLPSGWRAIGLPDTGRVRTSPFDPRPLEWPLPFGWEGRTAAIDVLIRRGGEPAAPAQPTPTARRLPASSPPSGDRFGVSIVGCGNFARAVLLYNAMRVPGVALRGICDIRPEVSALHAQSLGAAFHTADFAEILADDGTRAVLVTTDHGSHAAHVAAALLAGKAAHVEKPPACTPDQLTLMLDAIARTGGTLTVGYNRPHAPAYPHLMSAVAEECGPISMAMIVKGFKLPPQQWYYWPDQGTRIAGNLCHWLDLGYRVAGGARPVAVHVMRDRARIPAEAADIALLGIRYDDGSLCSIAFTSAGDDLRGVREWIEIRRGNIAIRIEDFDRIEIVRGSRVFRRKFGRDRGHAAEIRHQIERLRTGRPDPSVVRDMILTSAILFAAQRSFDSGQEEDVVILDAWRPFLV